MCDLLFFLNILTHLTILNIKLLFIFDKIYNYIVIFIYFFNIYLTFKKNKISKFFPNFNIK